MILKKPYGILIKNFRLIHLLLSTLTILVLIKTGNIVNFFKFYIENNYSATITQNMANNYISPILYVAIILSIIIFILVYILFRYKKKPKNFYLMAIIYYTLLFISVIISKYLLNSLEVSLWNTELARVYRDTSLIIYYPQYIFIVISLIRTLGFNIKQFNFQGDLKELNLVQEDSEEVELNLEFDTHKAQRKFRRFIREFKYYFKENAFIIISILGIVLIIIGFLIYNSYEKVTYNFGQKESFYYEGLNISIEDSILTNLNYAGDIIRNDRYYLLLKVKLKNENSKSIKFDYTKFLIYVNEKAYKPKLEIGNKFIDYAEPFKGNEIKTNKEKIYLLAYEIPKEEKEKNFSLSLYNGNTFKKKEKENKAILIKLSPILLDKISNVKSTSLNNLIDLSGSYLEKTILNIKKFIVTNKYEYTYESCIKNNCKTFNDFISTKYSSNELKSLIVMDYDFSIDTSTSYAQKYKDINNFATNFFKVQYIINNKTYITSVKSVTPTNLKDKLVVEVPRKISEAESIEILITIRNKRYTIKLK